MTDRPFTTPEYPSTTADEPFHEQGLGSDRDASVGSHTSTTFAEAQVAASPHETGDSAAQGPTTQAARQAASTATDEARSVAADARATSTHVAETAREQAHDVASETRQQARELFHQVRGEMTDQASVQTQRTAGGLRALADELGQMVGATRQPGLASDVARQASDRSRAFADWLEAREPGDILAETRDFARRRPGTFLAAAAALGFLGGRLTRGLADDTDHRGGSGRPDGFSSTTPTYGGAAGAATADPAAYGTATSVNADDPDRVGAGIDPATYTHPDPAHRPVDRGHGAPFGDDFGRELR